LDRKPQNQTDPLSSGKKKILIVDDDQTILYLLRKIFMERGYRVSVAKDGLEAIERIKTEIPVLVITDLKTPSLSGTDLISSIRKTQNDLPIIVMTAYPNLYPEKKEDKEVKAYFRKPFDIYEMLFSVERILGV